MNDQAFYIARRREQEREKEIGINMKAMPIGGGELS